MSDGVFCAGRALLHDALNLFEQGSWRNLPLTGSYTSYDLLLADWIGGLAAKVLREMPYELYLQTEYWKKTKEAARQRAKGACQLCNKSGLQLDTHHRTYERRGCELPEDLIVLCRPCHAKFHDKPA